MRPVTSLDSHRSATRAERRGARRASQPILYFDLASPYTYLAAERAERMFAGLRWVPAATEALRCATRLSRGERALVSRRAAQLELPLVWPLADRRGCPRAAMRVASLACEAGLGAEFVLAASRLAFCGGYSLDDPATLVEAAAAAGLELGEMLHAAADGTRDGPIEEAGRMLLSVGADCLPTLQIGARLFCGEQRLADAAAAPASA